MLGSVDLLLHYLYALVVVLLLGLVPLAQSVLVILSVHDVFH